MQGKYNGYFTIEASFVVPMVLFLYLLIITLSLFLYDRCAASQDGYLLAFRGSRFTQISEGYAEVIYGDMDNRDREEIKEYLLSRLEQKNQSYPCFVPAVNQINILLNKIIVTSRGWKGKLIITKEARTTNPLQIIKRIRKENGYAGSKVL